MSMDPQEPPRAKETASVSSWCSGALACLPLGLAVLPEGHLFRRGLCPERSECADHAPPIQMTRVLLCMLSSSRLTGME